MKLDKEQRKALIKAAAWAALTYFLAYPLVSILGVGLGRLALWPAMAGIAASLVPVFVKNPWLPSRKGMRRIAYWSVFYLLLQDVLGRGWGGWPVLNYVVASLVLFYLGTHVNRVLQPKGPRWSKGWRRHEARIAWNVDPWAAGLRDAAERFARAGDKAPLRDALAREGWDVAWLDAHLDPGVPRAARWVLWAGVAAWAAGGAWLLFNGGLDNPGVQLALLAGGACLGAAWVALRGLAWWRAREARRARVRALAQARPWQEVA